MLFCCFLGAVFFSSCRNGNFPASPEKAVLQSLIDSARNIPNSERALEFVENAYRTTDQKTIRDWYNYYSFKYFTETKGDNQPGKTMVFADSMLLILEANNLETVLEDDYMQALYAKGDVLFSTGQYTNAFEYYFKGRMIGQTRLTPCQLSDFTYRLGMVLFRQERYREATGYFRESFQQQTNCPDNYISFYRCQELLNNTGLSFERADMPDSAILFFSHALRLIDRRGDDSLRKQLNDVARAVIWGNMADIYLKKKSYPQALALLKKSLAINTREGNDNRDAGFTYIKLARHYGETGDLPEMLHTLQLAGQLLQKVPSSEVQLDWHRQMAYYYEYTGQPLAALQHTKRFMDLKDSLRAKQRLLRKTDMMQRVKMLEEQRQIAILKEKNNSKTLLLYLAGFALLMGLPVLFLIYLTWKRSRKYIHVLTALNKKVRDQRNSLKHTLGQLEASHKEKDKILQVVAHDLRSPVTGIAALTDLLLLDEALTADQRDNLELIRHACEGSLALSKELLDATIEFNPENWEMHTADINVLLSHQIELLRFRAQEKQQEITLKLPEHPVPLFINNEKICRVIDNLVTNAIKFSPAHTRIDTLLEPVPDGVRISIRDHGIGIPESIAEHIFDMFTEAKRTGTAGERSYGLGLSISKQIVEAHGGKIWFENEQGSGTVFRVFLPDQG